MGLGDHACLSFVDDDAHWSVLAVYSQRGLAKGEKVLLITDPALSKSEIFARLDSHGPPVEPAWERGQLNIESTESMYLPPTRFSIEGQIQRYQEQIELSYRQEYPGFRACADMAWALDPDMDLDRLVTYEYELKALFTDPRCSVICCYDRKRFSKELLDSMDGVHPMTVLEGIGSLDIADTESGLRLAGEVDLLTREQFITGLEQAFARFRDCCLLLDLTDLSFLDAHGAGVIIRLAAGMPPGGRLKIRCSTRQAYVLRILGAESIPRMVLNKV
ncbi:MEDS domain-containing protein [Candidatus Protofrankia californiensis]|uniref:MEDS domain-containing protein n=1 Tax=Candidatus Protofrankia californiensis TaxID=1839754 RepID=UPI0013E9D37B|nr:MEDS domain-containing protein [Candidatus Protofrankia californiensis]